MLLVQTALMALAVAGASETVLLDFYSDSCAPCRQMDPTLRQLAAMGYPVRKVNCGREPELAARFGVKQVPCFVMLVGGREVDRVVGMTSLSRLEQMCKLAESVPQEKENSPEKPPPGQDFTHLIAATVRLRIEDGSGRSCGSGTIIDSREGEALILTCGHIFRDSKGKGRIEVDLFGPTPANGIPGQLLHYDLQSDIGLLTIRVPGPVQAARVAPPGYRVAKGDAVINVGCNNGQQPTARPSRVSAVDKFLGPPNLVVSGLPVQGRSGGGLFSADGLVIGVCNAADPADNDGLYAALAAIHAQLDRVKLSHVYQPAPAQQAAVAAAEPPPMPRQMPPPESIAALPEVVLPTAQLTPVPGPSDSPESLSDGERAALEEIHRRRQDGAEVICVIRSRSDPRAPSEVIVLDKVSPAFLEQLVAEARPQDARHLTSLEIPRRPEPLASAPSPLPTTARPRRILEYSAPPDASTEGAGRAVW